MDLTDQFGMYEYLIIGVLTSLETRYKNIYTQSMNFSAKPSLVLDIYEVLREYLK